MVKLVIIWINVQFILPKSSTLCSRHSQNALQRGADQGRKKQFPCDTNRKLCGILDPWSPSILSQQTWLKGNWPKVARTITYWPFFENIFCSRNFWFPTFGLLMFLMKSHFVKELLRILEKNLWNRPQKWVFGDFFFEIMPESKNDQG